MPRLNIEILTNMALGMTLHPEGSYIYVSDNQNKRVIQIQLLTLPQTFLHL